MKRPLAYITAAWLGGDSENAELAAQYYPLLAVQVLSILHPHVCPLSLCVLPLLRPFHHC